MVRFQPLLNLSKKLQDKAEFYPIFDGLVMKFENLFVNKNRIVISLKLTKLLEFLVVVQTFTNVYST